jgi:iron complex outermembrane receptor protein
MNKRHAVRLLATTVLAFGGPLPAYAQQSEQAAEPAGAGDIIVTARRTEERLQDVPISITVFNQEQLSQRNVVLASDLATYTPSLSVNQRYGPEKASFAIRGFNQDIGTSPSVGVYFADVVAPRAAGGTVSGNNAGAGSFMDLQNVQVLKGPQGTLFGRNTTGGAVLLVPQKPTDRLEGYVEGSAGNFDMWRAQGVLNVPLAETFKVRVAVDRNKRDGFMRNRSGIGPDRYNDLNYFAGRLSIVGELTPNLENYTIATYSNSFTNGHASHIAVCERDPASRTGGQILTAQAACDQIDRQAARGEGFLDVDINKPDPFVKIRQWQVINTTTWQATDTLTIKNIASYSEYRERSSYSLYGDNFTVTAPFPTAGAPFRYIDVNAPAAGNSAAQSTFTEELQFQGNTPGGRLNWQAGAYIERSRPIGFSNMFTGILLYCTDISQLECANPMGVGFISDSATRHEFDSTGFYAQGTYKLTDTLSVTGGLRYTIDKTTGIGESSRIFPTTGLRICDDTLRFGTAPVSGRSECHNEITQKSEKPTWLIDLDYKPNDNILLYAKYARGYRQGGVSMTNIGVETWGPEKVDAYEIGAKTTFSGAVRGYFNVAGFYNDFQDQQVFGGLVAKPGGPIGGAAIVNAGKSRIQGIEVDASATVFDGLRFDLGYTYLDTEVKELVPIELPPESPFLRIEPSSRTGGPLTLAPKHRVTLGASYTLPLPDSVGEVSLGAIYVHTAKQLANEVSPIGVMPATDLLNLNVDWADAFGSPVDLAFFVTNVTNEIYPVNVGGSYASAGFDGYYMAPPRMWGFRLRYSFGE